MIGGSACHGKHIAIDVLIACVGIVFLELKVFFNRHNLLTLSSALFLYVLARRFHCPTGLPASQQPKLLWTVQHKTWYLPINYVVWMFPSGITHIECAAFLLVIIQEDIVLRVLVLEVA